MGTKSSLVVGLLAPLLLMGARAYGKPAAGKKLFNGKSLAGWDGNLDMWKAEGGEIVGRAPPGKKNDFLCTKAEFADFELSLSFKLEGDDSKNSGVQFRTKRIPGSHEVSGYQADAGKGYWGALYDEARRNKVLLAPTEDVRAKAVRADDWNTYVIAAQGPQIRLTLNGIQTVDYQEDDATVAGKGVICLQLHAGKGLTARFKDLVLKPLPPAKK